MNYQHKSRAETTDLATSDELPIITSGKTGGRRHKSRSHIHAMEDLQGPVMLAVSISNAAKSTAFVIKDERTGIINRLTETQGAFSVVGTKARVMKDVTNTRPRMSAEKKYLSEKVIDLPGKAVGTQCSGRDPATHQFTGSKTPIEREATENLLPSSAELINAQARLYTHILNSDPYASERCFGPHSTKLPSAVSSSATMSRNQADVQPTKQRIVNSNSSFLTRELPFRCAPHTHVVKVTRASQRWIVRRRKGHRPFDFLAFAPPVLDSQTFSQESSHPGFNTTTERNGQVQNQYLLDPYSHLLNCAPSPAATPTHHQNLRKSTPTHTSGIGINYPFPTTVFLPQALPSYSYNTATWGSVRAW